MFVCERNIVIIYQMVDNYRKFKRAGHSRLDVTLQIYSHTLKNNDKHCCEAVTKAILILPKATASQTIK